jgi:NADP-dependent 3-hydroxy acid dehydrogenase YdfG
VVGSTSTIGRAIIAALTGAGWRVRPWTLPHGGRVELTDPEAIDTAASRHDQLNAAVYAAGLFDWADADVGDPDVWNRLVQVNLTAAMRVSRRLLPALLVGAPSTLVLLGSGAGLTPYPHNPAYVASKHGLVGFARATFLDVRDRGVRVSVINPGLVAAGAGLRSGADPDRLLRPEDIAAAVLYVVSAPPHACVTEIDLQPLRLG